MSDPSARAGELELIAALRRRFAETPGEDVRLGIGDDAAVVGGGGDAIVTCDSFVEGVHFRRVWSGWPSIGYKAAVTTISDLAAMAADPVWMTVALGLGPPEEASTETLMDVVDGLGAGIAEAASAYGFAVVGGDVSACATTFLSLTAGGRSAELPILRSGAHAGDLLVVTHPLGCSAAALLVLGDEDAVPTPPDHTEDETLEDSTAVVERFLRPSAGFEEARVLRALGARALIDVSDGVVSEAIHLATASGVGVVLRGAAVPVDDAARRIFTARGIEPVPAAIASGEEYALLAAVPAERRDELEIACMRRGWTIIGSCTDPPAGVLLEHADGSRRAPDPGALGWRHFG